MKHWLLVAALFFCLYGAAVFWPVLLGREALFWHDVSIAYLPLRTAAADAIADGHLPVWESRMGNGFPVLAEGQAGVFYPPHVIGYLGLPQYHVYAILLFLHCVLGATSVAVFCRLLGMRAMPCLTAGLVYAFSGFFITHGLHITIVEAAAWLPVALICIERWLQRPKSYAWLLGASAALSMQELVAMPQIFFYSALTILLYVCVAASTRPGGADGDRISARPAAWRAIGAVALVIIGAALLAAVQIVPTAGLIGASGRDATTAQSLRELCLSPRNLAYFVHPYIFGSYAEGNYFGRDHHYEVCGFAGTIALLFGLLGAVHGRGRARTFALILVPLSLAMALARQNPIYELFPYLPGLSWFRGAGRYVLLTGLGLSVLAAYGLQVVGESRRALRHCLVFATLGAIVCVAVPVTLAGSREFAVSKLERVVKQDASSDLAARAEAEDKYAHFLRRLSPGDPTFLLILLCFVLSAAGAALCLLTRLDPRWLGELALALTVLQLFAFALRYNPTIDPAYYGEAPEIVRALNQSGGQCVYVHDQNRLQDAVPGARGWAGSDRSYYLSERELLRPNRQVLYGARSANVFYALVPERYWALDRVLSRSLGGEADAETGRIAQAPVEILSVLGSRIVVSAGSAELDALPILRDFGTWRAYLNEQSVPLAYFPQRVVPCADGDEALAAMCADGFTAAQVALEVSGAETVATQTGQERAEVLSVSEDRGHVTVRCRTDERALLVLRETYDSHFRCLIDGDRVPVHRANYLFRGVWVQPGEHEVEFIYHASDLWLGAVISLLALMVAAGMIAAWNRRSRQARASQL